VIFGKKFPGAGGGFLAVLLGFLEGGLEKVGVLVWFFAGKNLVDSW
jgi:hypothetical protein